VRRRSLSVSVLLAAAVALAGCSSTGSEQTVTPAAVAATPSQTPVPSDGPTLTAASQATWTPEPAPTAAATTPPPAKPAAPSYDVAAVQRQLTDLRYYGGPVDGKAGPALRSAVMAFQKVQGIGADGAVGAGTLAALAAPQQPALKASSPANRVEVDLTKQVLYVVKGGAIERILPVSSGNGATYKQKNGSTARALTPTGWYKIERRIVGERHADLGTLYDPQYFYKGWAIHGSNSVPAGPASHGCVRVTRWDAKWLLGAINNGMSVYLYGGKHTFTAGSSAPGTDTPSGDGGGQPAEQPTQQPTQEPKPQPTQEPKPQPTQPTPPPATTPPPSDPTAPPAEPTDDPATP
jgi:peptidoglycan hydrolase-like protein with peptidoglycan-binding domain